MVSKQTVVPHCRCGGKASRGRTSHGRETTTLKIVNLTPVLPLVHIVTARLGEFVGWVSTAQKPGTTLAD